MSKILTIGRDTQCDICLNDPTDVVSRRHAVLECAGGKYYLTDQSRNGTYINGMKMARGERVPVTRRDVISFAHVCDLDWTLVPKANNTLLYVVIALVVVAVLAVAALLFRGSSSSASVGTYGGGGGGGVIPTTGVAIPTDSTAVCFLIKALSHKNIAIYNILKKLETFKYSTPKSVIVSLPRYRTYLFVILPNLFSVVLHISSSKRFLHCSFTIS